MLEKGIIEPLPGQHNLNDYEAQLKSFSFSEVEKEFSWYETGKVNLAYEAVDRQAEKNGSGTALYYSHSDGQQENFTFQSLAGLSNQAANMFSSLGIKKGDRVGIFLPRSPELYISFLAAIKLGAVVVPLFEAFMEDALQDRLQDSGAKALVTSSELLERVPRGELPDLKHILLTGENTLTQQVINWWTEVNNASPDFTSVWVARDDPAFILYAAGADGKPKGIVHVHECMVGLWVTAKWVHDLHAGDIYWCTADPGFITGIAYGFLAPWLHGIPVVVRGGRFNAEDWCQTLSEYGVTVWYSAPTAFRMMMSGGDELLQNYDLSALRHILSVGEPLTAEVLSWSIEKLGQPVYDTWWMSETGMNIICNYRCLKLKLGSIGKPFPGIETSIVDDDGNELPANRIGNLAIKAGWPAMFRNVWKAPEKYEAYFKHQPWFVSGDAAYRDDEGYYFFQGRVDGLINTAGERVSPWEVENKLTAHPAVAGAGVAGKPDNLRGEIVKAYVVLNSGYSWSDHLAEELRNTVKSELAAHTAPREWQVTQAIPRTADGSVDRKALKTWAMGLEQPE